MKNFNIQQASENDLKEWLRMRLELWPQHTEGEMLAEMKEIIAAPLETPVFIAFANDRTACGFLEGGLRKYADGCETNPVGYIEGWYVDQPYRELGVGGLLVKTFETWCRQKGMSEVASDAMVNNDISISAHKKLGYTEIERCVHFAKKLT